MPSPTPSREAKLTTASVELNESVEFKSLPSGLHNVQEDLIYFVHGDEYAGISAFINEPAEESNRNALMLAVGALLPLSHGRLGKSWKHATRLKELAKSLSKDPTKTELLEDFWESHRVHEHDEDEDKGSAALPESPSAEKAKRRSSQPVTKDYEYTRKRVSTAASAPPQILSPHHPALSLSVFLDTFGPLIFPLYKAALLRKRILLVGQAPVELACNYVYDISILSGLPSSVLDLLPLEPLPTRLLPLFAVGVHDMPTLAQGSRDQPSESKLPDDGMGFGWVANTTDDILSLKAHLHDTLVTLPPPYTKQAKEKVWPRLEVKKGTEIKATQRDLRRYRVLRRELHRLPTSFRSPAPFPSPHAVDPLATSPSENTPEPYDDDDSVGTDLAEFQSWSALAYNSFMWWASAGEKRTDLDEEEEYDAALLRDSDNFYSDAAAASSGSPDRQRRSSTAAAAASRKSPGAGGRSPGMMTTREEVGIHAPRPMGADREMTIIAFFHRLTTLILKTLADIIDAADYSSDDNVDDSDDTAVAANGNTTTTSAPINNNNSQSKYPNPDIPTPTITINSENMSRMGLDIWSESDKVFVQELVAFYFGRKAEVKGARVECCGVRVY